MLSSLILSFAVSTSPVAEVPSLDVQEIGRQKGTIRIQKELDIHQVGRQKGTIRIQNKLDIQEVGRQKGTIRI